MKYISETKNLYKIKKMILEEMRNRIIKNIIVDRDRGAVTFHTTCGITYKFTKRLGYYSIYISGGE